MSSCIDVERVVRELLMQDYNKWSNILSKVVEAERKLREKERKYGNLGGWEWYEAKVMPTHLKRLVELGIVEVARRTNKRTYYRLPCLEEVARVLSGIRPLGPSSAPPSKEELLKLLDKYLSVIEGYDDYKEIIKAVVVADKPVHALLVGAPASGKTIFLMALEKLPGAFFVVGYRSTKAGLGELLLQARPKYLLVDELDKMSQNDISILLNLMEEGRISIHLKGTHVEEFIDTRVVATANRLDVLPAPIVSRFEPNILVFDGYTRDEYIKIVPRILERLEGVPRELGKYIAERISEITLDIRGARNLARMVMSQATGKSIDELKELVDKYISILSKRKKKLKKGTI